MSGILRLITPTNLEQEKEKFLSSRKYNPTFRYGWDVSALTDLIKTNHPKSKLIKALLNQSPENITKEASQTFNTQITKKDLQIAQKITSERPLRFRHPDLSSIVKGFESAFKVFNLDYRAVISQQDGFNVRPRQSEKLIIISKNIAMHFFSVEGMVRHEMSHVVRFENASFNQLKRSPDYLPTEEGLASFVQDYGSKWGNKSLFQHAVEYTASDIGLNGSLRDIYNHMRSLKFPPEMAWQRAARHKFGFVDTSLPGDIMKPAMYFFHEQKINRLSRGQKIKLYVGKISVSDLKYHKKYTGICDKKTLTHFFNL